MQVVIDLVSGAGAEEDSLSCFPFWIMFLDSTQGSRIRFLAAQLLRVSAFSPQSLELFEN